MSVIFASVISFALVGLAFPAVMYLEKKAGYISIWGIALIGLCLEVLWFVLALIADDPVYLVLPGIAYCLPFWGAAIAHIFYYKIPLFKE